MKSTGYSGGMSRTASRNAPGDPIKRAWHKIFRGTESRGEDEGIPAVQDEAKCIEDFLAHIELGQIPKMPLCLVFPKDHIFRDVIDVFHENSLIPPEVPVWTLLALSAQFICQKGITLELDRTSIGGRNSIKPNLWILLFASSASGKTLVFEAFKDGLADINWSKAPSSTAKLRDRIALAEGKPHLLFWDEFGQDMKMAKSGKGSFNGLQKLLLNAYNGSVDCSMTNGVNNVNMPAQLSILALGQGELVNNHFAWQDWSSGLMHRFTLVYSGVQSEPANDSDYGRKIDFAEIISAISSHGFVEKLQAQISSNCVHQHYYSSREITAFEHGKLGELRRRIGTQQSFLSRALFTARKLTLILHLMRDGHLQEVTLQTAKLAWQLIEGSLHDLHFLSDTPEKRTLMEAFRELLNLAYSSWAMR